MFHEAEKRRLAAQAKYKDRLAREHLTEILNLFLIKFSELPYKIGNKRINYNLESYYIFDRNKTKKDYSKNFIESCIDLIKFYNASIDILENLPENLKIVRISCKTNPENFEKLIDFIKAINARKSFHFSVSACYLVRNEDGKLNNEVPPLVLGTGNYHKFLPELKNLLYTPDKIYSGRTTVQKENKDLIKKILLNFYLQSILPDILRKDLGISKKFAYERLVEPGIEEHHHWRFILYEKGLNERDVFLSNNTDNLDLEYLILSNDAFSFYFYCKRNVIFDKELLELRDRRVREYDSESVSKLSAKISDIAHKLNLSLGFDGIYAHSGSSSARDQGFYDVYDILNNLEEIYHEFPFVGIASKKNLGIKNKRDIENLYHNLLSTTEKIYDICLIRELAEKGLLFRNITNFSNYSKRIPNITFNAKSFYKPLSVLIDKPTSVSIALASPKSIVTLNSERRKVLIESEEEYKSWRPNFSITICTPIEKCPETKEEILKETNIITSSKNFESNYQKVKEKMEKKIGINVIKNILSKVENEISLKEFEEFLFLDEIEFLKKYYKLN